MVCGATTDAAVRLRRLQHVCLHVVQRHPVRFFYGAYDWLVAPTDADCLAVGSREFGHRVKSISMSKFTDTEVKNMLKFGGNEVGSSGLNSVIAYIDDLNPLRLFVCS
jgi:hypothetical protein